MKTFEELSQAVSEFNFKVWEHMPEKMSEEVQPFEYHQIIMIKFKIVLDWTNLLKEPKYWKWGLSSPAEKNYHQDLPEI